MRAKRLWQSATADFVADCEGGPSGAVLTARAQEKRYG